MTVTPCIDL